MIKSHENSEEIGLVDIFKFIFSICIVAIHSSLGNYINNKMLYIVVKSFARLAVPYFFIISGYFIAKSIRKNNDVERTVKEYCKKLILLFIIFESVSIIINVTIEIINNKKVSYIFLDVIRHLIFYPWGSMWYVSSTIIGLLILVPFIKRNKLSIAIIISSIMFLAALLTNNYYFVIERLGYGNFIREIIRIIISFRNGLTLGFPYLAIGMKIYELNNKNNIKSIIIFCIFYLLYICEIGIIDSIGCFIDDGSLYIMQLPVATLLSKITINCALKSNKVFFILRKYSTGIFFLHKPFIYIMEYMNYSSIMIFLVSLSLAIIITSICISKFQYIK